MTTLNQLVAVQLSPEAIVHSIDRLSHYLEQVREEKRLITRQLLEITYSGDDTDAKGAVIRQLQASITRLLDMIHFYQVSHQSAHSGDWPMHDELTTFYTEVDEVLLSLMIGLDQHFSELLEPDLPLPYSYAAKAKRQLGIQLQDLERLLQELGLDSVLQEIVMRPVKDFLLHTDGRTSFRTLNFYRGMLNLLQQFTDLGISPPEKFAREVHYILLHLNFNAIEYYLFCINRLRGKLKRYDNLQNKITYLAWCIREIKSIPSAKKGMALDHSQQPILEQIQQWLEEERTYLQELHSTTSANSLPSMGNNGKDVHEILEPSEKLQTSLTVPQLALMVRIYIEEGIIRNTSLGQVIFFITRLLTTKKSESMEAGSFERKYDNPGLSTITTCKALLERLVARLGDYEEKIRACMD